MNLLVGYAWLISTMKLSDLLFHDSREQLHLQCITIILRVSCNSSFQVHSIKSSDIGKCVTSTGNKGSPFEDKIPYHRGEQEKNT